jgi:hypothetical protein
MAEAAWMKQNLARAKITYRTDTVDSRYRSRAHTPTPR